MGSSASREQAPVVDSKKNEATALLTPAKSPPAGDGALEAGGPINIYDWRRIGYLAQYFAVGVLYGGLPATQYGFFVAYLNVPAYVSAASSTLASLAWSFKIFFALITDALPIGGYRRRPYMVIGWSIAAIFLLCLGAMPLPRPYYCLGADGEYDLTRVCNEAAAESGMPFALLMMMVAVGYVQADVAADALTVQYARREPLATRGRTQTTAYLVRELGMICSQLIVGFGMNGPEYNGSFSGGISFNAVCIILAIPAVAMIPISWFLVEEPKLGGLSEPARGNKGTAFADLKGGAATAGAKVEEGATPEGEEVPWSLRTYFSTAATLLRSRLLFEVLCFFFLSNTIGGIGTTAGPEVQRVWADVENLQNQLFSIAGHLLFVFGLWLVRTRFLDVSWRVMLTVTLSLSLIIDMPFTFCTIFNVVRNQYFFLDDGLITSIPTAMNFVVSTYVMVEVAEPGTEGITYGILTTASNIGSPVASGISNWIFGHFRPSLSHASNYVADAPSFRNLVALSYVISYIFGFASLAFLPLLPNQKADTQERKASTQRHSTFAIANVSILGVAIVYAVTVNFLAVFPATSCLEIAGGEGCGS